MNVRSILQHSGLVLTSALSFSLMIACGDTAVQDGGVGDSGPMNDGGPVDAGVDAGCVGVQRSCLIDSDCCSPLVCDQNTNKCKVAVQDAGLPDSGGCSKSGQSCLTYADCCAGLGLACNTVDDAGATVCGPNTVEPTAKCVTNGNTCGDGGPCCSGNCVSGTCVAWPVCGVEVPTGTCTTGPGQCTSDLECCNGNVCDGGACATTCGQYRATCTQNSDCCIDQGVGCWNVGTTAAPVLECIPLSPPPNNGQFNPNVPCGPPGSSYQCELTSYCSTTISGADECASAGLVCKTIAGLGFGAGFPLASCQIPAQFDTCIPGGPACQPLVTSSATNMQCLPLNGGNICLQPCVTTSDCVSPFNSCQQVSDGKACITDFSTNNPSCAAAFGTCNSAGSNDGLCQQITFSNGQTALICSQEATDGGGVGSCCNGNANRQNGELCAYPNVCNGGICVQSCSPKPPAGTAPDSGLLCDTSAGPQYCFFPGVALSGGDLGSCTPPCDALNLGDAGSCPTAAPGNPTQACTPALLFDQTDLAVADTTVGVCTSAPTGTVNGPGQSCLAGASCQEGSICLNDGFCRHLCGPVNSQPDGGDNGCKSGDVCWALGGLGATGTQSTTKIGFCDTSCDGGAGSAGVPCP